MTPEFPLAPISEPNATASAYIRQRFILGLIDFPHSSEGVRCIFVLYLRQEPEIHSARSQVPYLRQATLSQQRSHVQKSSASSELPPQQVNPLSQVTHAHPLGHESPSHQ